MFAVADEDRVAFDGDVRIALREAVAARPVGGGAVAVEQPRLCQHERAGAHRAHAARPACGRPDPGNGCVIAGGVARSRAARDDQRVDRPPRGAESAIGDQADGRGGKRAALGGDDLDRVGARLERGRRAEHLRRPDHVERLDPRKGDDHDAARFVHGAIMPPAARWQQGQTPDGFCQPHGRCRWPDVAGERQGGRGARPTPRRESRPGRAPAWRTRSGSARRDPGAPAPPGSGPTRDSAARAWRPTGSGACPSGGAPRSRP